MAVPKKKTSHQKQHKRRANWKLEPVNYVLCPNCGEAKISHLVCTSCGYYNGREYLKALPKKARKAQDSAS